jgi:tetratricopeptide (TPR) repeat protein
MFLNLKCFLVAVLFCLLAGPFTAAKAWDKIAARSLSHYIMGVLYEDLEDFDQAIQEYQKAVQSGTQNTQVRLKLASSYIKKNNIEAAIAELKLAIADDPAAVQPHALLSLLYSIEKQEGPALAEYEAALKNASVFEPANTDLYKGLGAVYIRQNKLIQAKDVYKLLIGLAPNDPEVYFYSGSVNYELKDMPAFERDLKAALKLKPDYHEALNFLGYAYLEENKNIATAGKLIKKALALDPENPAYLDSLGWFYFKKGKLKDAQEELEKASALLEDPVIFDHLGDLYSKTGDQIKARSNWEHALALDPSQGLIKDKLDKLNGK